MKIDINELHKRLTVLNEGRIHAKSRATIQKRLERKLERLRSVRKLNKLMKNNSKEKK